MFKYCSITFFPLLFSMHKVVKVEKVVVDIQGMAAVNKQTKKMYKYVKMMVQKFKFKIKNKMIPLIDSFNSPNSTKTLLWFLC